MLSKPSHERVGVVVPSVLANHTPSVIQKFLFVNPNQPIPRVQQTLVPQAKAPSMHDLASSARKKGHLHKTTSVGSLPQQSTTAVGEEEEKASTTAATTTTSTATTTTTSLSDYFLPIVHNPNMKKKVPRSRNVKEIDLKDMVSYMVTKGSSIGACTVQYWNDAIVAGKSHIVASSRSEQSDTFVAFTASRLADMWAHRKTIFKKWKGTLQMVEKILSQPPFASINDTKKKKSLEEEQQQQQQQQQQQPP
jgi:hypothetical protein